MGKVLLVACVAAAMGSSLVRAADDPGKPIVVLEDLKGGVHHVAFSPDGKEVAAVGGDGTARVWDAESGKLLKTLRGHEGPVLSCAWSPDGKQLVTGGYDKAINVWDMSTGEIVDRHQQMCPVWGIAFVADEKHFVTLCGETVRWWAEGTEAEMFDKPQGDETLAELCSTPKGDKVVVSDTAGMVRVLDGLSGDKVAEDAVSPTMPAASKVADKSNWVMSLQALGEAEVLAGDKQSIWVWDWEKGTKQKLKNGGGYAEVLTPQDRKLLVLSLATTVEGVDLENKTAVVKREDKELWITAMSLTANGERMAISSGGGFIGNDWKMNGKSVVEVFDVKAMEGLLGSPAPAVPAKPAKAAKKAAGGGDRELP